MTVLVAAASEHGATAEIAAWIGARLAANGVDVDVRNLDEVDDVERYDAFVLGSAVYLGQWLKTARSFVDGHADDLARRPTWLFSSGPELVREGRGACCARERRRSPRQGAVEEWAAAIARELEQLAPRRDVTRSPPELASSA